MERVVSLFKQAKLIDNTSTKLAHQILQLEEMLLPYLDFSKIIDDGQPDFSIQYQASDSCFVLEFDAMKAPLSSCLAIIEQKGKLTHDDYLSLTI